MIYRGIRQWRLVSFFRAARNTDGCIILQLVRSLGWDSGVFLMGIAIMATAATWLITPRVPATSDPMSGGQPKKIGEYRLHLHGLKNVLKCTTLETSHYYIIYYTPWATELCRQQQAIRKADVKAHPLPKSENPTYLNAVFHYLPDYHKINQTILTILSILESTNFP